MYMSPETLLLVPKWREMLRQGQYQDNVVGTSCGEMVRAFVCVYVLLCAFVGCCVATLVFIANLLTMGMK